MIKVTDTQARVLQLVAAEEADGRRPWLTAGLKLAAYNLERKGLLVYHGGGSFGLTDAGRKVAAELSGAAEATPEPEWVDDSVKAEDAPLGVQLWPTRSPQYARNFTLERVELVREIDSAYVKWTCQNGTTRVFLPGEWVAVKTKKPL